MKKKSMIYPTIFMLVLAFVLTFALAALNEFTKPVVAFNAQVEQQAKILYVFDIETPDNEAETISKVFEENVTQEDYWEGMPLYKHEENGQVIAYAVPFNGPGLWGGIEGYVGVDAALEKIIGLDFIQQDETPGLGGRIEEAPYKEQYRDVDISTASQGNYVVNRPAPAGNIDAISGATQTSNFVVNMINEDLDTFINERGGN